MPDSKAHAIILNEALRAEHNHALEYAIERANQLSKPLVGNGGTDSGDSA
ncbi:MAG: hypothetical protein ACYSUV_08410 [Planctomycetota bacterium]